MAHQHRRFHTNGSNALKPEAQEFDVFVKPQFTHEHESACIIEFKDAQKGTQILTEGDSIIEFSANAASIPARPIRQFTQKLKNDRILGDLFTPARKNDYRLDDLVIFAKGFTVTGFAAFILILFGV